MLQLAPEFFFFFRRFASPRMTGVRAEVNSGLAWLPWK